MNKNFEYMRRSFFFSIFFIALLLGRGATAATLLMSPKSTQSTNKMDVAASSETTYIFVDPQEIKDIMPPDTFLIKINVTEAPQIYAWGISLSWNSTFLEWFYIREGDFLKRPPYNYATILTYPSMAEANLNGVVEVSCSLIGEVPWASGSGELVRLGFRVKTYGSSVLNLFDTHLYDYYLFGSPMYTYYPNRDSFFYNQPFHDIAVTNLSAHPTTLETSQLVTINVTISNEGNYSETSQTFNVSVYADKTPYEYVLDPLNRTIDTKVVVGDEITVGTKTIIEPLAPGANTTLTFTWDTAGIEGGNYTISAEAKGDDDTRDNLFIGGTVTKPSALVHDIAITSVTPSLTEVTVGDDVTISVTVKNEGAFNETFDVTLYYDNNTIATQTDVPLISGTTTTRTFTWNTTGVPKRTYTIKAEASVVENETDTADNTFIDGTVKVRGAPGPNYLLYGAVATVVIIAAVVTIYILKFRKP